VMGDLQVAIVLDAGRRQGAETPASPKPPDASADSSDA
jgi:hypothetical protein